MSHDVLPHEHSTPIYMGCCLEHFIHSLPFNADVKDVKTKKYILGNKHVTRLLGITPQEYIGLSLSDWHTVCKLKDSFVEHISRLEHQVCHEGLIVQHKQDLLSHEGFVRVEHTIKKPIFSPIQRDKIVGIFSHTKNITPYINPSDLFSLYHYYYPTRQAIYQLLKYLGIDHCFHRMPANRELLVLLAMRENSASKHVAKVLDVTYRTIEEYKARLRGKLKILNLDELLVRLRNCYCEEYAADSA